MSWEKIAEQKQAERLSRIPSEWRLPATSNHSSSVLHVPRECGILTSSEISITEDYDATALLDRLGRGTLKSIDVVTAFCKRAAIAQQLTNCLTEIFFEDALARAKFLDEEFQRTGRPTGPLHGLPISIKDTFKVKGYDASLGYAALCFKAAKTNSTLVDLLLSLGAVLYVKTNIPQTLMALDSHNNVFGRTLNPANNRLTPGGSSGGEGALVALRGSPLGVGTDVGGSIRVPAMCNGLYGVKPGHGRVPYAGQESGGLPGNSRLTMESTAGPIALSMRDCEMFLRTTSNNQPWNLDPDVVAQSWDQQISLLPSRTSGIAKPLVIGVASTDGNAVPHPPIKKSIAEVAQMLQTTNSALPVPIEIVHVDLAPLWSRCLRLFNALQSVDGGNSVSDLLESTGEPLSPWLQNRLRRRPQKSLADTRAQLAQKTEMQTAFLAVWRESGGFWRSPPSSSSSSSSSSSATTTKASNRTLDVIICPPAPHPVPQIDSWNTVNYTAAFNLLDYPAGVLPIRTFTKDDAAGEMSDGTKPLNGWDKINRELWTNVDRNVYVGSALSVQVVAPRLQERKLVEAMAVIDQAVRLSKEGRGTRSSRL